MLNYKSTIATCGQCECQQNGAFLSCVSKPFRPKINEFPALDEKEKSRIKFITITDTVIPELPDVLRMEYPLLEDFREVLNPSLSCASVYQWYNVFYDITFESGSCDLRPKTLYSSTEMEFTSDKSVTTTLATTTSKSEISSESETVITTDLTSFGDSNSSTTYYDTDAASIPTASAPIKGTSTPIIIGTVSTLFVVLGTITIIFMILRKKKSASNIILFENPLYNHDEIAMGELQYERATSSV